MVLGCDDDDAEAVKSVVGAGRLQATLGLGAESLERIAARIVGAVAGRTRVDVRLRAAGISAFGQLLPFGVAVEISRERSFASTRRSSGDGGRR